MPSELYPTIDQTWIITYEANLRHALQQQDSKFAAAVMSGTMEGEKRRFTYTGKSEMHEVTKRLEKTVWNDVDYYSRWAFMRTFTDAWMFDRNEDVKKMLTDPQSDRLMSAVYAARRKKDEVIIEAFDKVAKTGKNAETEVPFNAEKQEIGVRFNASSNTGLTLDKLHELRARFDESEVNPNDPQFITVSPRVLQDLLKNTELKSADYNTVKALYEGDVTHFMGFEFIKSNMLPINEGVRSCYAWSKSAMQLAISTEIHLLGPVPHPDYNMNNAFEVEMACDATRLYDDCVFRIQCQEQNA
jgi:hypothetical protein